jgi:hypothetical protein
LITLQHTQECLSLAYVQAVAGSAGVNLAAQRTHDYGIDGSFRSVVNIRSRRVESGFAVDFQMKATTVWEFDGSDVLYDLESKTFNDLAERDAKAASCILILLCLPKSQAHWVQSTEDQLVLKHCCYWTTIIDAPTPNLSKKRIRIPRTNTLTSRSINAILDAERNRRLGV